MAEQRGLLVVVLKLIHYSCRPLEACELPLERLKAESRLPDKLLSHSLTRSSISRVRLVERLAVILLQSCDVAMKEGGSQDQIKPQM